MDIDPYWYAYAAIVVGGTLGLLIPYLTKVYDDPETSFDMTYFWGLLMTLLIGAVGFVPDDPSSLAPKILMGLLVKGFGIQAAVNMAVTRIKKSKG